MAARSDDSLDGERDVWRRAETIRRKDVGRSIVYVERYYAGVEARYYIEANGPDYRVWKRVPVDEARALELYTSFRFWVWLIEAFGSVWATRVITWLMHRLL